MKGAFAMPVRFFILSVFLLSIVFVPAALAEDRIEKKQEEAVVSESEKTPVTEWMAAENALIDKLSDEEKEIFLVLRSKHGVIRTVDVVHRDVGNAVKGCGKDNPDMKDEIYSRFAQWERAVLPIINTAEKFLKTEIDEQTVVTPKDFRKVLKMNDAAFDYTESKVEKQIVTDEAACRKLLQSMDRTEDHMVSLLQDMLLPENVIRNRLEKEEEAEKVAE